MNHAAIASFLLYGVLVASSCCLTVTQIIHWSRHVTHSKRAVLFLLAVMIGYGLMFALSALNSKGAIAAAASGWAGLFGAISLIVIGSYLAAFRAKPQSESIPYTPVPTLATFLSNLTPAQRICAVLFAASLVNQIAFLIWRWDKPLDNPGGPLQGMGGLVVAWEASTSVLQSIATTAITAMLIAAGRKRHQQAQEPASAIQPAQPSSPNQPVNLL